MELVGSMPHSYPVPNQPRIDTSLRSILILPSHLRIDLPKHLFPVDLLITILKAEKGHFYTKTIVINFLF